MNRSESINSMTLNETKRTFSLSSIHKNFQIYKNVLKMAATFILLSLISATLWISLNMVHPKDSTIQSLKKGNLHIGNNETLCTLQSNSMWPDLFVWTWHCCRTPNEVAKRKKTNNTNNWDHHYNNALKKTWKYIVCSLLFCLLIPLLK